ncbi:MAG TPA: glucosaminidase domain-containing protein [Acidimicrobiales bacterium]|jgi:hypothetical protein
MPSARFRRRAPFWVAALVALIGALVPAQAAVADPPGSAVAAALAAIPPSPPAPDDPISAVSDADQAVSAAVFQVFAAYDAAEQAAKQVFSTTQQRDAEARREQAAEAQVQTAQRHLAAAVRYLEGLSAQAYVSGGTSSLDELDAVLRGDSSDKQGGVAVMFDKVMKHQIATVAQARSDLAADRRSLTAAKARLVAAQKAVDDAQAESRDREQLKDQADQAHDQAVAQQVAARQRLRTAAVQGAGPIPLDIPLVGLPKLDPEDLAGWFAISPYRPKVATPIPYYAAWFIDEGRQEGIRGDIAFAQAVLETGGFTNDDSVNLNNFSGIGHCDTCGSGWSFGSPQLGVRAQIQLLKSYAIKHPTYANPVVDSRLKGPAGCCPTWGDLTTVWATDPGYGPAVMGIYQQIVDFALKRHAALLPPG